MNAPHSGLSVAVLVGAVAVTTLVGIVDLVRMPGWAWKKAGRSKLLNLAMVVLLPGVGTVLYVFGTRRSVAPIASTGRASHFIFERLGDRKTTAGDSGRAHLDVAIHTWLGSFGERRHSHPIITYQPVADRPEGARPEPVPVPDLTGGDERVLHFPGGLGRPYRPHQRKALPDGPNLAEFAAQILEATPTPEPPLGYGRRVPSAAVARSVPESDTGGGASPEDEPAEKPLSIFRRPIRMPSFGGLIDRPTG